MDVVGEYCALVRLAVAVGVLENDDLVLRFAPGVNMRIGCGTTDPQSSLRIPSDLNRAGDLGKLFLGSEQVDFEARIHVERRQLVGGRHPFVGAPALRGHRQRRHIVVVDLRRHRFAIREIPDAPVPIVDHDVEVAHGRKEIEVAILFVASAGVIERVQRSIAEKEPLILLDHRLPDEGVYGRGLVGAECSAKQRLGEHTVSRVHQVRAVERQIAVRVGHGPPGGLKHVHKTDLACGGNFRHRLGVGRQAGVVQIGGVHAGDIFVGNRRHQHDVGSAPTVVGAGLQPRQKASEPRLETRNRLDAAERFVEPERGKNDVGFLNGQMLVDRSEIVRARLKIDFIRGPGEIPNAKIQPGRVLV